VTNLEICKKIAEIGDLEWSLHPKLGSSYIVTEYSEVGPPTLTWHKFNPLTDKALCWDLMLKHDIKLSRNGKNEYVGMWSHCRGEDHSDPQMAICLAIIEKYK